MDRTFPFLVLLLPPKPTISGLAKHKDTKEPRSKDIKSTKKPLVLTNFAIAFDRSILLGDESEAEGPITPEEKDCKVQLGDFCGMLGFLWLSFSYFSKNTVLCMVEFFTFFTLFYFVFEKILYCMLFCTFNLTRAQGS